MLGLKQALVILQAVVYQITEISEFAETNGLSKSARVAMTLQNLTATRLQSLKYLICKTHARLLIISGKKAEKSGDGQQEQVKFSNFYDQVFHDGQLKQWQRVSVQTKDDSLSLVDGGSLELNAAKSFDVMKVKVNKSYGLCSTLPNMQAVPATAHFFDLAGGYLAYGDAAVDAKRFEV